MTTRPFALNDLSTHHRASRIVYALTDRALDLSEAVTRFRARRALPKATPTA